MRGAPATVVASLALSVLATVGPARADERASVRLGYDASRADAGCPDESSFRNLVAARLGYDPFIGPALDRVDIEIVRSGAQLRGHASILRAGTKVSGGREIVGLPGECEAVTAALATTVAIALDPVHAMAPAAALPPLSPPPTAVPPAPPAVAPITLISMPQPMVLHEPPAPPPREPIRLYGTAAAVASVAAAPSVTLGGEIGVGFGVRAFSLELMGRVEGMPGAARVPSGDRLEVTLITAAIVPCAHLGGFNACAFGRLGALQGYAPDVATPTLQTSVFASAGVRSGYTFELSRVIGIRGELEAGFPLVRTLLGVNNTPVWTASPVIGALSVGAVVRFQ
jgi:hypothetical protein